MNLKDGVQLVKIARKNIEAYLNGKNYAAKYPARFREQKGVFVTLTTKGHELRGCIGYPEPVKPLIEALLDASVSAATRDPRFAPVAPKELDKLQIEVTVLSKPELVPVDVPDEYLTKIEVGKHGLIAEAGANRGLLLPQVPVEWGWDVEEFLNRTCEKAFLPPDAWRTGEARIYKFTGEIFSEELDGKIVKK